MSVSGVSEGGFPHTAVSPGGPTSQGGTITLTSRWRSPWGDCRGPGLLDRKSRT